MKQEDHDTVVALMLSNNINDKSCSKIQACGPGVVLSLVPLATTVILYVKETVCCFYNTEAKQA